MFSKAVYPALEELKEPLTWQQLNILQNQLQSEEPNPSPQTQFNYAWGLIKSDSHKNQQQGVDILLQLYKAEISMKREVLYYLSLGSFKLGDYSDAKRYVEMLLKIEPGNAQAQQLLKDIDDKVTTDGLIGIGIAGGVLAVGIGLIGTCIAKTVLRTFNDLRINSGKPTIRSNGVKEWTVLASVVAIVGEQIHPITLATGVKVLPNSVRSYSRGMIVHDMHAEILALRLFNFFILEECTKKDSFWVKQLEGKFRFLETAQLALFVTEPPCGDLSMKNLSALLASNEPWLNETNSPSIIHRGRNNFGDLGVVRTKPGRSDSLISYSKSCSDKLCLRQLTGICNATTASIFEKIFIRYLVVNNVDDEDFHRCFIERFQNATNFQKLILLKYDHDEYKYHKCNGREPSPVSLLYVVPNNHVQVLNNGVKSGSNVKNKPPKMGTESLVCNRNFIKMLSQIQRIPHNSYLEFKRSNVNRERLKDVGKKTLQNWWPTDDDDFPLYT
ncbi:hypothetical protein KGF56_002423 [Candida oxycetoniae]|uniref:A to I editase domain-containing protein n=1 Tax=Candida oxycetoniae TaxID=497107 RepID=A0AAI9SXY1_9ASCO|nr:uncharacterized protein KGF56_002423 [Candida oxycetoniae]KAI3404793.1 hypothetical protein KGF56_002423 [Candida oxycetoniae]